MHDINIPATKNTPEIVSDIAQQTLTIRGEAYPENAAQFYAPFFTWLEEYLAEPGPAATKITIDLLYFNSTTSKVLLDLFDRLERAAAGGRRVVVNWRYHKENDMILEYGEEFSEEVQAIDFRLQEYHD